MQLLFEDPEHPKHPRGIRVASQVNDWQVPGLAEREKPIKQDVQLAGPGPAQVGHEESQDEQSLVELSKYSPMRQGGAQVPSTST